MRCSSLLLAIAAASALSCRPAPAPQQQLSLQLPSQLSALSVEQLADLHAQLTIPGVLDEPLAISADGSEASGSFVVDAAVAGPHPFTILLTYEPDGQRALLARLDGTFTIAAGADNALPADASAFDGCAPVDGRCANAFDLNRNGIANLDDLAAGIDPFPAPPFVDVAPEDLPFPSGIRLGGFARQVVVIENVTDRRLRATATLVDAPGVTLSLYETEFNPANSAQRRLQLTLDPFQEALIAVSFAPVNPFLTVGDIFVEVVDDGANDPAEPDPQGTTNVRQAQRIRILANADGELQPPPTDFGAAPLATDANLKGLPVQAVEAFNTVSLFNGLPVTGINSEASPAQPGIPYTGRTIAARFSEDGADVDASVPADAAFLVDVPAETKLSVSLSGLESDVDLAVFVLDDADAISDDPTRNFRLDKAAASPEALELAPVDAPRRALVVLGRVEEEPPPETEGALTVPKLRPFALSAHLTKTPEFTAPPSPLIGPLEGGNRVLLVGRGFHPDATVTFADGRAFDCTFQAGAAGATSIACVAPPGSLLVGKNPATIVVANPGRDDGGDGQAATLPEGYAYEPPSPRLDALTPAVAPSTGSTGPITLTGAFFSRRIAEPEVRFGEIVATGVAFRDSGLLEVNAPPQPAGIVSVSVRNVLDPQPGDAPGFVRFSLPSNVRNFTYVDPDEPAPTLTSVDPATGAVDGGDVVLLAGTGFQQGALVLVDGVAATDVTFLSSTSLSAVWPARDEAGLVEVAVVNPDGQRASLADGFEYFVPDPSVDSVFPDEATVGGGTFVIVSGAGFRAGIQVEFSQGASIILSPSVNRISSSTLLAASPSVPAAGDYTLTVRNLDGRFAQLDGVFRFVQPSGPPPRIDAISPNNGDKDLPPLVTLAGVEFRNPSVIVGAENVPLEIIDTAGASDFVSFFPPAAAEEGPVIVRLINDDGQSDTAVFNYTASFGDAPVITSVTPGEAAAGQTVTILGRDFDVVFGLGGADDDTAELRIGPQTVIPTSVASNRLTAVIPNLDALVGESGSVVAIEVTNIDGQSTSAGLVYLIEGAVAEPPVIAAVSPSSAAVGGRVVLSGSGFDLAFLKVGATLLTPASSNIVAATATSITFDVPSPGVAVPASVLVEVQNQDGQRASATLGITGAAPPRIDSISPDDGDLAGGTPVLLRGAGFDPLAVLRVAGAVVVPSSRTATEIGFTAPPSASGEGTVAVTVTNPDGQSASTLFRYTIPLASAGDPAVAFVSPAQVHALVPGDLVTVVGQNLASVDNAVIQQGTGPTTFPATIVSSADLSVVVRLDAALPDSADAGASFRVVLNDVQTGRSATSPAFDARRPRVTLDVDGANGQVLFLGEFFNPAALESAAVLDNGAGSSVDIDIDSAAETFLSATLLDLAVPGSAYQLDLTYRNPLNGQLIPVQAQAIAGVAHVTAPLALSADDTFVPALSNLQNVVVTGLAGGAAAGGAAFGSPTTFDLLNAAGARVGGGTWAFSGGAGSDAVRLTFAATAPLAEGAYGVRLATSRTTALAEAPPGALALVAREVFFVNADPLIIGSPASGDGVFLAGDRIVAEQLGSGAVVVLGTADSGATRPPGGGGAVDGTFTDVDTSGLTAGSWLLCAVGAADLAECPLGLAVEVEGCAFGLRAQGSGLNACGGVCNLNIEPGTACDLIAGTDLDTCDDDVQQCAGANATVCTNAGFDVDGDNFSPGALACGGDCNDANGAQSPAQTEVCDVVDNNCDGAIDEGCPCEPFVFDFGASTTDWLDPLNWSPDGVPGFAPNHCPTLPAGLTLALPSTLPFPLRTLVIEGTLTHTNGSPEGMQLVVTESVTVTASGAIDVSARGAGPNAGTGAGANGSVCQCGNALSGAGGGYGGSGGFGNGGSPGGGNSYDVVADPTALGSGGGFRACASGTPGSGGGRVDLDVQSGTLTLDGAIRADGGAASGDGSGGGSGGSIRIVAGDIVSTGGTPIIQANGGNGRPDSCNNGFNGGGGGAGGRIAVTGFASLPASVAFEAKGGLTGGGAAQTAGAGTIFVQAAAAPRADLTIDNGGAAAGATTRLPSATALSFADVVVKGAARAELANGAGVGGADALTIETGATLTVAEPLAIETLVVNGTLLPFAGDPDGVTVLAGDVVVGPTGAIDASGRGFGGQAGPGRGNNGSVCQCGNALSGSGGAYGGNGGFGNGGSPGAGLFYGSTQGAPLDLGSGGGLRACAGTAGGTGGGLVRLDITSSLVLNGALRANGLNGFGDGDGGGAGGSIWVTASTVTTLGTPVISASGGNGRADSCNNGFNGGGGGGGGRISILADSNNIALADVVNNGGALGGGAAQAGNPGITMHFTGADSLVALTAPARGGAGDAAGTVLTWTGVGPLGTRHFHVEVDDDPAFDASAADPDTGAPPIASVSETAGAPGGPLTSESVTTPPLLPATRYFWRVVVHNSGNGVVGGSTTFDFTTP